MFWVEIILSLQIVSARVVWLIICTVSLCHLSQKALQDIHSTIHLSFDVGDLVELEKVQRKTAEVKGWSSCLTKRGRKGWNSAAVWRRGSWAGVWLRSACSLRCWVKGQSYPSILQQVQQHKSCFLGGSMSWSTTAQGALPGDMTAPGLPGHSMIPWHHHRLAYFGFGLKNPCQIPHPCSWAWITTWILWHSHRSWAFQHRSAMN